MSAVETQPPESRPWITGIAAVICVVVFLGLAYENNYESWATLARWGYYPSNAIWNGAYWALLTTTFVHIELWHVVFNVYWLWVLGSYCERVFGSIRFLIFFVASAMVSSAFQLALSDTTGIGMSGVVYAIFGLMWPCRSKFPLFQEVLTRRTIQLFVWWLFGCVVVTYLKIWEVGNWAHFSGALFGGAVAGYFVLQHRPRLMLCGLTTLVVLAAVPMVWCPWSPTWLAEQAFRAHSAERLEEAERLYSTLIRRNPQNAWAYINRSAVNQALGKPEQASMDYQQAIKLNPDYIQPNSKTP